MEEDGISIIVPIYKVPKIMLKKCIESIISQTYNNIEILLIDDGSPDECGKICDEYAKIDYRIKVIHQENKGPSGARNAGIFNSKLKWITFVDGDDWIEKNYLKKMYESTKENNADLSLDVLCCGYLKDYGSRVELNEFSNYFIDNKVYSTKQELEYMKKMVLNFSASVSGPYCKLINRKFIRNKNIIFDEKLKQGAEDIEFCFRLISFANKIKTLNVYMYHYMYNENSISAYPTENDNYMTVKCFQKMKKMIPINDIELNEYFNTRFAYSIISITISSYFNPKNKAPYKEKLKEYKKFIDNDFVKENLNNIKINNLDFKRKIVMILIKNNLYSFLCLLGKIRKKEKGHRKIEGRNI